jgi:RecA-family ATPase
LPFIKVTAWHGEPVPDRQWAVFNRIPMNNVTLFSGEGSIGKSITSLQLATAMVLGKDWLGTMPEMGPVLVLCCEDDRSELHRRLALILHHYGASFTELGDLHLISLAGEDALMATPNRVGIMQTTPRFSQLSTAACDIHPKLIVLDNSADIFGGNENDRAQVRQFIGLLRGLAIAANAGVLLTSHPSLTGITSGSGISGSTAWNASVRSRLYMKRATTERDEEPDPYLRVIEVMKNNYGPIGETINVRWKDGVFVPIAGTTSLEKLALEQRADNLLMEQIDKFKDQGRALSDKKQANNYAPSMLAKAAKTAGLRPKDIENAMTRLFEAGRIKVETYGPPSKGMQRLIRVPGGRSDG